MDATHPDSLVIFLSEEVGIKKEHLRSVLYLCYAVNITSKCDLVCPTVHDTYSILKRRELYLILNALPWAKECEYCQNIHFEVIMTHMWADDEFISKMKDTRKMNDGFREFVSRKWNALNEMLI